jgi:RNA polymerase sigma factor (sigma-70 family)
VNSHSDSQLLRAYAEHCSEPAFAELVRRHVDLVYSAALRMVCDSHLAQDVTQGTFLALAKSAIQLTDRQVLSGWLHRTAQNLAAQTVRTDVRRRAREQEAVAMNELSSTGSDVPWEELIPHLDAVLGELNESDRDAVLLRYFEKKSAQEMAVVLGVSAETAQKRVNRAVERLREFLAKRGVTIGATGLAAIVSANAVQAAPVGLALTISTATALTGTTLATTTAITATKAIAMTALQKTIVTATIAALVGVAIYEGRQAVQQRQQVQLFQQQQSSVAGQMEPITQQQFAMSNRLAVLNDENERLKSNTIELLRLRGIVARLRRENEELAKAAPRKETVGAGPYVSANELVNAGLASPEATAKTLLWATRNKDMETLAKLVDKKGFEEAVHEMMRNMYPGVSDTNLVDSPPSLNLNLDNNRMPDLKGYQIMSQEFESSNDVVLSFVDQFVDGTSHPDRLALHLVDGEWKINILAGPSAEISVTNTSTAGDGTQTQEVVKFKSTLKPTFVPASEGATNR